MPTLLDAKEHIIRDSRRFLNIHDSDDPFDGQQNIDVTSGLPTPFGIGFTCRNFCDSPNRDEIFRTTRSKMCFKLLSSVTSSGFHCTNFRISFDNEITFSWPGQRKNESKELELIAIKST